MKVGIRELKAHTSKYLSLVNGGEVVTVTRHGNAIAEIVPVERRRPAIDPDIQKLISHGALRWGNVKPALPQPVKMKGEGPTASEIVLEGRG